MDAVIQFIIGVNEVTIPEIQFSRSLHFHTGTAIFHFEKPSLFEKQGLEEVLAEISGMYLIDSEGSIVITDVSANFTLGCPKAITATYMITNRDDWDRFFRFMKGYAEKNGLVFNKRKPYFP